MMMVVLRLFVKFLEEPNSLFAQHRSSSTIAKSLQNLATGVLGEGKKVVVSNFAQRAPSYYDHGLNHPRRYNKIMAFSVKRCRSIEDEMATPIYVTSVIHKTVISDGE
ncbi:hypothetical protein L1887_16004 [Cichorium endivia]|nr:hypothetical protein L1887_16004 [Cichorium endivia]